MSEGASVETMGSNETNSMQEGATGGCRPVPSTTQKRNPQILLIYSLILNHEKLVYISS
jgi:hypothetical protein